MLINQCPHNLDLIQWVTGLTPSRVTAVAVREVNEPGARCAADLAAHASGSPTGQSSWTF